MTEFYGDSFSAAQYELLAVKHIDSSLLKNESELFQTKWFDYLDLHPTKATYLYAGLFKQRYQRMYATLQDHEQAQNKSGFWGDDFILPSPKRRKVIDEYGNESTSFSIEKKANTTGLWTGRQHADRLGIPYDKFIWYGMQARYYGMWQRLPNPCQIYSDGVLDVIMQEWNKDISEGRYSSIWEIRPNTPIGIEYQHWDCKAIKSNKVNKISALANKVYLKKSISEQIALNYFSSPQLRDAQSFYNNYIK